MSFASLNWMVPDEKSGHFQVLLISAWTKVGSRDCAVFVAINHCDPRSGPFQEFRF